MPLAFFTAPFDLNSFEETYSTPAACDAGLRDVAAQMGTLNRFLADQKSLDPSASHRPRIEGDGTAPPPEELFGEAEGPTPPRSQRPHGLLPSGEDTPTPPPVTPRPPSEWGGVLASPAPKLLEILNRDDLVSTYQKGFPSGNTTIRSTDIVEIRRLDDRNDDLSYSAKHLSNSGLVYFSIMAETN